MLTQPRDDVDTGVGRFLAESLQAYGVTHVFFMDAILRRSLAEMESCGITRILAHTEQAAAYMADGYARASRRPAVCMAQSVGATNLASGLQDAFLAGSAVVALTGRHVADKQYRNAYQEVAHEPIFSAVTKFTARAETPAQFGRLLRQAFRVATTGAPGPVHLDIAGYTGAELDQLEARVPVIPEPEYAQVPPWRLRPDPQAVRRAAAALATAQRPVLIAGMGAMLSDARQAVVQFVEKCAMPVASSLDAKAILPAGHPLYVGVVGTYSAASANRLVEEADLVLFVGSNTDDQVTNNWTLPSPGTRVIQVDIDPAEAGRNFAGTLGIIADPRTALEELAELLPVTRRDAWCARARHMVREWQAECAVHTLADTAPIRPERLCRELGEWLPENAILFADTGYASHWSGVMLPLRHDGQAYVRAAGSLGWAFPAALGAYCAAPGRPVVCFTGDGGFMYHLAELETARRWNLKTITVVNNNSRLAQGMRNLNIAYAGRLGKKEELFVYRDTDFARLAQDFGCVGRRVEQPSELRAALDWARAADAPVVIDVVTDPDAMAPLPWTPGAP